MNFRNVRRQWWLLAMSSVLLANCPALAGEEQEVAGIREYSIHVALLSFMPGEGLKSCRSYGGGTASGNATVGHWIKDGDRNFGVTVQCKMKSHRFWATVRIEPSESDKSTEARGHELDLSEFQSQAIDMAKDDDGRVYRLNLMPSVQVVQAAPKTFRTQDLRLESWSFPNCPVILNDEQYLGRISCSHGQLAWLDIPGTGMVEFSLMRFAGAEPWGVLNDGAVNITHPDGVSLQITGVTNGVQQSLLLGGPYRIWVRWKEATHSLTEYRRLVKDQLVKVREQIEAGNSLLPPATIERLERLADSGGICLMSNGVRGFLANERLPEKN